ncbi:MAG TPA: carboxypeptidase-like regulatory domain-containing protein [Thermoanaerobaculia bacterium]|nr:carboxypeptidase-like regulatory domain-containing protein [Thermoanaerobaculia bacterium]
MVLRQRLAVLLVLLSAAGAVSEALAASAASAAAAPGPGEVILPLHDYLALVEKVERLDRERAGETAHREAPVSEVVLQRTVVTLGALGSGGEAEAGLTAHYEALVQGHPKEPLLLPWSGLAAQAEVHALAGAGGGAAAGAATDPKRGRGVLLVAPAPGRYAIDVRRLTLAPVAAPVAEVEVELPADLAWSAPGAVAVDEKVAAGRRTVRLVVRRGEAPVLEIQRRLDGTEAGKLLAQSVVLTLFQLRPDGLRRHDVVLYEVSRGSLASLAVDLPPELAVEQVATDEGDVVPVVEARHLTVHRKRQLQGIGYLVLTSTPRAGTALPVQAVAPALNGSNIEVRARYLVVSSSVAADVSPQPAASWSRVDLSDLPPALGEALQTLDLTAAWRLSPPANPALPVPPASLAVALLPAPPRLPTVVRQRDTTTLLTVDGTVLHRDLFTLEQAGAALDLTLPAGAVLWSAKVGEQTVRPVARQGTLSVPLGFLAGVAAGELPVVEVVSVLERQIPKGRSRLALDLPQVASPVVAHVWRLLLPEGARYRFREGTLRPVGAPSVPPPPPSRPPTVTYSDHGPGGSAGVIVRVADDKGAALPGVTVTLQSSALAHPVVAVANAQGTAIVPELPPGFYKVEAQLEGFSSVEYPHLEIPAGKLAEVEIVLQPAIEETITVTAEAPLLDERRQSTGMTFSNRASAGVVNVETRREPKAPTAPAVPYEEISQSLQQGLVGGVRPLPVAIPESGKALLLSGALPPARVAVELDVKGKS